VALPRTELTWLRTQAQDNVARVQAIGEAVWQSLMANPIDSWFLAARARARENKRGMRVAVSMTGAEPAAAAAPGPVLPVALAELPIEALYERTVQYLGVDADLPLTRCLQEKPDVGPEPISYPLRILLAVAMPSDRPGRRAAEEEVRAVRASLGQMTDPGGPIVLDVYHQPTRSGLIDRLRSSRYNIFHFVGHGAFGVLGDDPTPQGHLVLIRHGDTSSDPVPSPDLANIFKNSGVRLVVLTACSSAQPAVDGAPYGPGAFGGVAQRLVAGGIPAVVAMQFDFEDWAASEFSRSFYSLLVNDREIPLDVLVAKVRQSLSVQGTGRRSWITPTLTSRCADGRPFILQPFYGQPSEDVLKQLAVVDELIGAHRMVVENIDQQPPAIQAVMAATRAEHEGKLQELLRRRGDLLGETVRVYGGRAAPGERVEARLVLRTRVRGKVPYVAVNLTFPPDRLTLLAVRPGKDSAGRPADRVQTGVEGRERLIILNPAGGADLPPGEYEIAVLEWQVSGASLPGIVEIAVVPELIARDGNQTKVQALNGLVFIPRTAAPAPA
jgi:hypothetical protein